MTKQANIYDTVFDVSVALLAGRILRGGEVPGAPAWGIVDCERALGAFDVDSNAWHRGIDGRIHRFSREDAETRARRLTGSSFDGSECAAVEIPQRPKQYIAGRHCNAVSPAAQFEAVDWSNGPAEVVAVGSAFDAAFAFVLGIGERAARQSMLGD